MHVIALDDHILAEGSVDVRSGTNALNKTTQEILESNLNLSNHCITIFLMPAHQSNVWIFVNYSNCNHYIFPLFRFHIYSNIYGVTVIWGNRLAFP